MLKKKNFFDPGCGRCEYISGGGELRAEYLPPFI